MALEALGVAIEATKLFVKLIRAAAGGSEVEKDLKSIDNHALLYEQQLNTLHELLSKHPNLLRTTKTSASSSSAAAASASSPAEVAKQSDLSFFTQVIRTDSEEMNVIVRECDGISQSGKLMSVLKNHHKRLKKLKERIESHIRFLNGVLVILQTRLIFFEKLTQAAFVNANISDKIDPYGHAKSMWSIKFGNTPRSVPFKEFVRAFNESMTEQLSVKDVFQQVESKTATPDTPFPDLSNLPKSKAIFTSAVARAVSIAQGHYDVRNDSDFDVQISDFARLLTLFGPFHLWLFRFLSVCSLSPSMQLSDAPFFHPEADGEKGDSILMSAKKDSKEQELGDVGTKYNCGVIRFRTPGKPGHFVWQIISPHDNVHWFTISNGGSDGYFYTETDDSRKYPTLLDLLKSDCRRRELSEPAYQTVQKVAECLSTEMTQDKGHSAYVHGINRYAALTAAKVNDKEKQEFNTTKTSAK